jgi:elongation factor P
MARPARRVLSRQSPSHHHAFLLTFLFALALGAMAAFLRMEVFVASIEYSQVRKGMVIVGEGGQLLHVVDRDLNTPGNWRAILQLKLKNLKTGSITINRVRPQDKVEQAYLDKREMQYLYQDGDGYVFMDTETFDQITLGKEWAGDLMMYMKEGNNAQVVFYETNPISLELPATVDLKVTDTEPSVKGATAAAQYKPATLETGLKITVPPFVSIGEMVAIDTRTGEYLSRAK